MQFMAKGNRFFKFIIIFILIFYSYYIFYDNYKNKSFGARKTFEMHLYNLKNNGKNYDAIIIGGSNALWGLSAKQLSDKNNLNYYNLSIVWEGQNSIAHEKFITKISNNYFIKNQIKQVIYSSNITLNGKSIENFNNNNGRDLIKGPYKPVWGSVDVGVKPFISFYQHIKNKYYLKRKIANQYQAISTSGDLDFSSVECTYISKSYVYKMGDVKKTADFLNKKADFLSKAFPNANIVVLIPSHHMYMKRYPREWVQQVIKIFEANAQSNQRLIAQPPIPSVDCVCDESHHPNEKGREWRTNQLIQSLRSNQAINF